MARAAGNPNQQIVAELTLSESAFTQGNVAEGQRLATEALEIARSNGLESLTARSLVQVGNVAFVKGSYDQARGYFEQALEFARRYGQRRQEARAMTALGSLAMQQGNVDEAMRRVQPALAFFQRAGYRRETVQCLLLMVRARRQQGDFQGALQAGTQQLAVAQEIGDRSLIALSEEAMGIALAMMDRIGEALPHFRNEVAAAQGSVLQVGYAHSNAGRMLVRLGHYQDAEHELQLALDAAGQPLDTSVHLTFASMALSQRRLAEALKQSEPALKSSDSGVAVEARWVTALASANTRAAAEAVQLAEKATDRSLLGPALLASAELQLNGGQAAVAIDQAMRAQQMFERLNQPEREWRAWLTLARAYVRAGDRAKAKDAGAKASAGLDNLARAWAPADFLSYTSRPDIQEYRKQLGQIER
jgi:tetratricopeptide (TPR) repeat protein